MYHPFSHYDIASTDCWLKAYSYILLQSHSSKVLFRFCRRSIGNWRLVRHPAWNSCKWCDRDDCTSWPYETVKGSTDYFPVRALRSGKAPSWLAGPAVQWISLKFIYSAGTATQLPLKFIRLSIHRNPPSNYFFRTCWTCAHLLSFSGEPIREIEHGSYTRNIFPGVFR